MKLRVIELFGGIGACSAALKRIGIEEELVDYVEIDKYAVKSFNAMNGTNFEPQDITKWDKDIPNVDLIMHGSPCQDISLAGLQKGADENSGTRSSLMYETLRIVGKLKPKYVVWENVKNLVSKKHFHNFQNYLDRMDELGYKSYWKVLNSKDYGIPQNRERVFTISIRKDIDKTFEFPQPIELKLKLKDMLEENVNEKYFLSDKMIQYISADNEKWSGNNKESLVNKDVASTINTGEGSRRCDASNYLSKDLPYEYDLKKIIKVGKTKYGGQTCAVYGTEGTSPTLDTMQDGHRQPKVLINSSKDNHHNKALQETLAKEKLTKEVNYIDGYNRYIRKDDISGVISTRVSAGNQTFLGLIEDDEKKEPWIAIKNATKLGYLIAYEGDGVDISSRMKYHRGNVQPQLAHTVDTQGGETHGVIVQNPFKKRI